MTFFVLRRPHGGVGIAPEEYDSFDTDQEKAEQVVHALRQADRENWYWLSRSPARDASGPSFWAGPSGR